MTRALKPGQSHHHTRTGRASDGRAHRRRAEVLLAALLTYGLVLFQVLSHVLRGELEAGEPPIPLHVARDGSLALPAVVAGVLVVRQLVRGWPGLWSRALATGAVAAGVMAAGAPVHERLFGGGGHEHTPAWVHTVTDGATSLLPAVLLAGALELLLSRALDTGPARGTRPTGATSSFRRTQAVVAVLLLSAAVVALLRVRQTGTLGTEAALSTWARDVAVFLPCGALAVGALRAAARNASGRPDAQAAIAGALGGGAVLAAASVVAAWLHPAVFAAEHQHAGAGHAAGHAVDGFQPIILDALAVWLVAAAVLGTVDVTGRLLGRIVTDPRRALRRPVAAVVVATLAVLPAAVAMSPARSVTTAPAAPPACGTVAGTQTVTADVVALDQEIVYNRLGATNPAGLVYALRRDVVDRSTGKGEAEGATLTAGEVTLRPDKRPRPLTLRVGVGDCLQVRFQNLLDPTKRDAEQPADRHVGFHVKGLALVGGASQDDGSFVGENDSSLVAPGDDPVVYNLYAEHENTYLISNPGAPVGGEGAGGTIAFGLFGAVNVEPFGTDWYRSQVTRTEMDLAASAWTGSATEGWTATAEPQVEDGALAVRTTPDGQPVVNYDAVYPTDPTTPGYDAAKKGQPILRILEKAQAGAEVAHSDLNAVISGKPENGYQILKQTAPDSYWKNDVYNMSQAKGEEPFREFTVIFHDEIFAEQAFPEYDDPELEAMLHSVRDGFGINYGVAGVGSEVLANRKGVGPGGKCVDCKYEEFFLTSWVVGDPAMIVDTPANQSDPKNNVVATKALYPDDPSNVHDSYINDRVKFRNLHAGPKEHHVFHLHAHQWQDTPNDERSSYLDSQLIGPGAGYTYEIAYGGSGNRNKTVGDAIFHCHFYPHFAQGMWEFWRNHDTFERGTLLDGQGRPAEGSRALPDGEITAGTPIPGVVPLPTVAMAPMPDAGATVLPVDLDQDGTTDSAQVDADGNGTADMAEDFASAPATNPGFPFFVPGVAGHRPPTAPLDLADVDADGQVEDGGLPRHVITGGTAEAFLTPLDLNKTVENATIQYIPENGTAAEKVAMDFHSRLSHTTYFSDGSPATGGEGFESNGLAAVPGAPYADPCRSDRATSGVTPTGVDAQGRPRLRYKAAVIQLDTTINKMGWHFPQQRIETLWDDTGATLTGKRAPEPLTMRLGVGDCAELWHTNLVPNVYELDDYQVRTPTDVIGQHIHLVKFDVTSADGSGNGFNYEDGTFSPQEVEERIHAVRAARNAAQPGSCTGDARFDPGDTWTKECPLARKHPFFKDVPGAREAAWGARTTVQRWYADPLLNNSWDQGVGTVFTHDHFGPSTHQQTGLYATVLVEPEGSKWRDPRTGAVMGTRPDGGPTGWRADVYWPGNDARNVNAHREFFLEYADFQHAYRAGGGVLHTQDNGAGVRIPSYADFPAAVNPSFRQEPPSGHERDLYWHPGTCANGLPRPCAEGISADDPGTVVINYRHEPVAARVFDPVTRTQAAGDAGDLSLAFQSRTDRSVTALNSQPTTYPALVPGLTGGDPWTPTLPVYAGDKVRVRAQVGAHEEQHNIMVHGLKWLQEPLAPNSGWRNSQATGLSEYFNLDVPVLPDLGRGNPNTIDYLYTVGASSDDLWNGAWGLLRSYARPRADLVKLPNNDVPTTGWTISNQSSFSNNSQCPTTAPIRKYVLHAVRAADVLGTSGLTYNTRTATAKTPDGAVQGSGPLIDPDALMYVEEMNLVFPPGADLKRGPTPIGLKPGTPVEPIVLRAKAGECLNVELWNNLPADRPVPDAPGYNSLPPIIQKAAVDGGFTSFNNNDIAPSSKVGLHAQLLQYDVRTSDGIDVGGNSPKLVTPGTKKSYQWYAGSITAAPTPGSTTAVTATAKPIELGVAGLMPSDRIKGASKGLIGAVVIEPPGATWVTDPGRNTSATVTFPDNGVTKSFREFVPVLQNDVNLRYGGGCTEGVTGLGCAVPGIASEGGGAAEDSEDGGQKAISYGADPLWFRLGIAPDTGFSDPWLRDTTDAHRVYSNSLVGGDPQTSVYTASPVKDLPARMRVVEPGGHSRGHVFEVHGHSWQRKPYVDGSDRLATSFPSNPTDLSGTSTTSNLASWWTGTQDGVAPSSHFDLLLPRVGGAFGAVGDFRFGDAAAFGNYQGIWGILRNARSAPMGAVDAYTAKTGKVLSVTATTGVLANDVELDGDARTAALVTGPSHGTVALSSDGSFKYTPTKGYAGADSFTYAAVDTDGRSTPTTVTITVS